MPITREKIRFSTDVPVVVTLEESDGRESQSQITGQTEYRYNVTRQGHPCFMYLPQSARTQLLRTRAQAGDQIEVVKMMFGRESSFSVQVLSDAVEPEAATNLRGKYPNGTATNGHANGNGNGRPPVTPITAPAPASQRGSSHMAQCLCAAVDAAIESMEYARGKGFGLQFTEAQIQDIGVSIFIGDQRNGGAA